VAIKSSFLFLLCLASVLSALGQLCLKLGASGGDKLGDFINVYVFLGFLFYGGCAVLWVYCFSVVPLVLAFPFTILTLALTMAAGLFFLGEQVNSQYWLGVVFVVIGLFFISY